MNIFHLEMPLTLKFIFFASYLFPFLKILFLCKILPSFLLNYFYSFLPLYLKNILTLILLYMLLLFRIYFFSFVLIQSIFVYISPQLPLWISHLLSRGIFLFPKYLLLKFLMRFLWRSTLSVFVFLKISLFNPYLWKTVILGI